MNLQGSCSRHGGRLITEMQKQDQRKVFVPFTRRNDTTTKCLPSAIQVIVSQAQAFINRRTAYMVCQAHAVREINSKEYSDASYTFTQD